jgi:hypothetical protein
MLHRRHRTPDLSLVILFVIGLSRDLVCREATTIKDLKANSSKKAVMLHYHPPD